MTRTTLAGAKGYRATYGQHFGHSTSAFGLHGRASDGSAYLKGEGDFPCAYARKTLIPSAAEDPTERWLLKDARPELYEFASALRNGVSRMNADAATRERIRLKIRNYYDSLPASLIHPSQIGCITAAVDRFVWSAQR